MIFTSSNSLQILGIYLAKIHTFTLSVAHFLERHLRPQILYQIKTKMSSVGTNAIFHVVTTSLDVRS